MRILSRALNGLVYYFAMSLLAAMTVIVFYQVITRYVFNYSSVFLQVLVLLFVVWFTMLGIAIGFRERVHISVEVFYNKFPTSIKFICDIFRSILVIGVGILFIVEGLNFIEIASFSNLAGTNIPSSYQYFCIPISGFLMCIYGLSDVVNVSNGMMKGRHK